MCWPMLPTHCRRSPARSGPRGREGNTSLHLTVKQQAFLDFVLGHYVNEGVHELDQEKLTPPLRLRFNNSISDVVAELGAPDAIRLLFAGFQKYPYQRRRTA